MDDGGIEGELGKKVMRREKGAQGGWGRGVMTETCMTWMKKESAERGKRKEKEEKETGKQVRRRGRKVRREKG